MVEKVFRKGCVLLMQQGGRGGQELERERGGMVGGKEEGAER